ncbi:acetyl-CoA carboxylase biotin carboxylase subunit [Paralimibaculum aggregatum]|nr:biotin carboxylase N-terminal domain-containing protein [Limibaculum sp. NKW23]
MFPKVLIANRGEIACRIIRACRALGIRAVAVHSTADADAMHVALADEAVCIGPAPAHESYLDAAALIRAARETGAAAIHPGYGFLAESSGFAAQVAEAGLAWIGPAPETIAAMGDKSRARAIAAEVGVPVLPGSPAVDPGDPAGLAAAAEAVGYPLLVKAASGGGGIGMRVVETPERLAEVVGATASMAAKSFGDGTVFLERYVGRARHVEVQVFGWGDGHAVHLGDRDCSLQRRFQKVVEEAPAPDLPEATRQRIRETAVALAASVRYAGAGTVEFVYDVESGEAFFLEMNTRIQVEHPVTEMVTGVDLVGWQIRQAAGMLPPVAQEEIRLAGHAVEVRLCAERPEKNFLPAPGSIATLDWPEPAEGLRVDTGVRAGDAISPHYDSLVAKVIVQGPDRAAALARLAAALDRVEIGGIATNLAFLRRVVDAPELVEARMTTGSLLEIRERERAAERGAA